MPIIVIKRFYFVYVLPCFGTSILLVYNLCVKNVWFELQVSL